MRFVRSVMNPDNIEWEAYYFCFPGDNVLVAKSEEGVMFPLLTVEQVGESGFGDKCFIGTLESKPCFLAGGIDEAVSDIYQWAGLRDIYSCALCAY